MAGRLGFSSWAGPPLTAPLLDPTSAHLSQEESTLQTTISTRVESGSFFDLDRKEQALIRLREEGAEWALPFALMEHLMKSGTPTPSTPAP